MSEQPEQVEVEKEQGEKSNITIRVSSEDKKMIEVLRKKYFINISEYIRASIKHLYDQKTKVKK